MRLSSQDFRRHGAGVQVCIGSGVGDCVGYWNQEKRSWAVRGRNVAREFGGDYGRCSSRRMDSPIHAT